MVLSFSRSAAGMVALFAIVFGAVAASADARELATAQGTIAISDARPGLRAPACSELVVEARDALDNHLIADTQPTSDETGACHYALSVPAQSAVWLRVQPVLVAGMRASDHVATSSEAPGRARGSSGSVALRFTVISPATYFFAPNEHKTITLNY